MEASNAETQIISEPTNPVLVEKPGQRERTEELEESQARRRAAASSLADVEPTPSLEKICREIVAGRYDGKFGQITEAMDARRSQRKSEVLAQVKEVFGSEFEVSVSEPKPEERPTEDNPFVKRAQVRKSDETLPGPYRIDPGNGNARRASGPEDQEGFITVTDIFGGHEMRVHTDTWFEWEQADDDEQVVDEVTSGIERQMVEQGKMENLPIEQRGAIIGGLSSADIAD